MSPPLPPLTAAAAASSWTFDPVAVVVAAALAAGYLAAVRSVRRRGGSWPAGRTAVFLLVGVGSLVVATTSCLAVYRTVLFWPAAVANTVLAIITPIGIALGDPITLLRRAHPDRLGPWVWRRARGRLARFATFPLVSIVIGVASPFALYFTPYFTATLRSPALRELADAQLLAGGLLFVLPLMAEDLLPSWCTWPVRAALAFVDGLADAFPGIAIAISGSVLTGRWYADHPRSWGPSVHWDQTIGGTLVLTITESVGVPLLVAVFVAWARADAVQAREVDLRLDAAQAHEGADDDGPVLLRPWWETEPGPLRERAAEGVRPPTPAPPRRPNPPRSP